MVRASEPVGFLAVMRGYITAESGIAAVKQREIGSLAGSEKLDFKWRSCFGRCDKSFVLRAG